MAVLADAREADVDLPAAEEPVEAVDLGLRDRRVAVDRHETAEAGQARHEALRAGTAKARRMGVRQADILVEVEGRHAATSRCPARRRGPPASRTGSRPSRRRSCRSPMRRAPRGSRGLPRRRRAGRAPPCRQGSRSSCPADLPERSRRSRGAATPAGRARPGKSSKNPAPRQGPPGRSCAPRTGPARSARWTFFARSRRTGGAARAPRHAATGRQGPGGGGSAGSVRGEEPAGMPARRHPTKTFRRRRVPPHGTKLPGCGADNTRRRMGNRVSMPGFRVPMPGAHGAQAARLTCSREKPAFAA